MDMIHSGLEPDDDQLNRREHDKKIAEQKKSIIKTTKPTTWLEYCRNDVIKYSDEEIDNLKKNDISSENLYELMKKFSTTEYQKFKDLFLQNKIKLPESGSEAKAIYKLIHSLPLTERHAFAISIDIDIKPDQVHTGIFTLEIMKAMLDDWCKRENPTFDRLQEVIDVGEKMKFLKPKKNTTPCRHQTLIDNKEDKAESETEGFLNPQERIEEVFQKEIIKAPLGITEFKKFARVSRGLFLDEQDIQDIIDNYKGDVEEQKLKMLNVWKEKSELKTTTEFVYRTIVMRVNGQTMMQTNEKDEQQAKLIYNAISQTKNKKWQKLTERQPGMLEEWGAVGYDLKLQMLRYWRNTRENKKSASVTVVKLAEKFLQRKAKKSIFRNRDFDFVCDLIANAVEDEDWMRFARVKLELRDEDIKRLSGKYAVLSEEQKYQLLKY